MSAIDTDVWITITRLRRHFHRLLREAERGATFTIVRRGRPVARLIAYASPNHIEEPPRSSSRNP